MSLKIVVVREYDEDEHKVALEKMEKLCEVGQRGKPSLITDLMGDPICRIRHFPLHVMLVAEYGEGEVVGVIRGCVKTVTRGNSVYVKLAYLLGLRVSPQHRRSGIGTKLVEHLEEWCKQKGAKYAYMATDCTNEASINLFTKKCGYLKFRALTMLVQPVYAHYNPINSNLAILHIPPSLAGFMYNHMFSNNSEFFPRDIDLILSNKLNLGTFMAIPRKYLSKCDLRRGIYPPSYAILSVWNTKEVFKLQVKGVSPLAHACCVGTRILDEWMPWLRVPSFPDIFRPFGVYFLYGLHMEGEYGTQLMKYLCGFVHNMARDEGGCGAIVAELGQRDPVREAVPHWSKFSWDEDMWCIKNLHDSNHVMSSHHCFSSRSSSPVIFVDPRDF
ncbi:hypothetical protein Lal_00017449 [Lupinus albus]|uniref:Putative methionine N(Alpha)-acetyltransferase NatB transcription regulator GNAT family n=1 Tax=Lupinus albus TaxID=3870 RepID=A0A6A5MGN5_LUPAL|nr:putative methionine N(alpha)-acetyltransferase NatB transcription regulator GNAT family [Lupinus albus]KAF1869872.1 hypothetical protein Lal_00017449 [Lupinus albus]